MATCKKIEVVIRGEEEGDLELALEEAVRKVRAGYTSGHDSNDTGGYYFSVTEGVLRGDWPA